MGLASARLGTIVASMDNMDLATAEAVRTAIREADLKETAVASAAGISPTTWRRRMSGARSFHVAELIRIARVIGTRTGELVDGVMEKLA